MIQEAFDIEFSADAFRQRNGSGYVYFLIYKGVLLYIGQTMRYHTRIATHLDTKIFDEVKMIECASDDLLKIEREMIAKYDPPLNRPRKQYKPFMICDMVANRHKECFRIDGDRVYNGRGKEYGVVSGKYAFLWRYLDAWSVGVNLHHHFKKSNFSYDRFDMETCECEGFCIDVPMGSEARLINDKYVAVEYGMPFLERFEALHNEAKSCGYKPTWAVYRIAEVTQQVSPAKIIECCDKYNLDVYFVEYTLRKAGVKVA